MSSSLDGLSVNARTMHSMAAFPLTMQLPISQEKSNQDILDSWYDTSGKSDLDFTKSNLDREYSTPDANHLNALSYRLQVLGMDHQVVPDKGGEQGMKGDQRFGAEAQKISRAGMAYHRGMNNGSGDNRWPGQMPAGVKLAQPSSSSGSALLICALIGDSLQVFSSYGAPASGDGSGLYQDHVDAEGTHFHAQGIAEGFKGILGGMVPGTHISDHPACHG